MLARTVGRIVLLMTLVISCARDGGKEIPAPPLPADLASFDAAIAERIEAKVAELKRAPRDAGHWRELGMLYHAHDQFDLATECYLRSRELESGDPRTHFYLALAEQRGGRPTEAIAGMRRVIELDPDYAPARWRLGLMLLEAGDAVPAQHALEEALARSPADPFATYGLARAHLQAGEADKAAVLLERYVKGRSDDAYAHFLLGTAYRRLGRTEDARRQLALGRGAEPAWSDPWSDELAAQRAGFAAVLAAATELLEREPRRAVEQLERLRGDQPANATLLINLGIGYRRTGDLDASVEVLGEAVRREPTRGLAHFHLALTYADLSAGASDPAAAADLMARALEHAERAVELQPTSPRNHAMRGELLARAGRTAAAVESFSRAVRDPQDPAWLYRLGGLLFQLQRWSEAIPALESYLARVGDRPDALLMLGVAQANAGHLDAARVTLERSRRLNPGDSRVGQAIEQLELIRGGAWGRPGSEG